MAHDRADENVRVAVTNMTALQVTLNDINWTLLASLVPAASVMPAIISSFVAYRVGKMKLNEEVTKIQLQMSIQREGTISNLRQKYIVPLRFFSLLMINRLK